MIFIMMISQLIVILNTGATQIMKCPAFNHIFLVLPHNSSRQRAVPILQMRKVKLTESNWTQVWMSLPPELFLLGGKAGYH